MSLLSTLLMSVAVTGVIYSVYTFFFSGSRTTNANLQKRVDQLIRNNPAVSPDTAKPKQGFKAAPVQSDRMQNYIDQIVSSRRVANWLLLAGVKLPLYQILLGLTVISVVVFGGFVLLNLPLYLCGGTIILVWVVPYTYFKTVRNKYIHNFSNQLPNALGMMANTIQVGHTAESALRLVTEVAPKPLATEFDVIHKEMMFGASFTEALRHLQQRIPTVEVQILVSALSIQQSSGGNLAEILRNLEGMIRDYGLIQREVKALTAEGKMSMVVMTLLPFVIIGMQLLKNSKPFFEFASTQQGAMTYGAAGVLVVLGIIIFNKMIKLEAF